MCHPGRPAPHGASHAGSSASERCHSTKSSGSRLPGISGMLPRSLAIGSMASRGRPDTSPYVRPRRDVEVDVPLRRVGVATLQQSADHGLHLRDVLGRPRVDVRRQPVEGGHLGEEGGHPAVAEIEVVLAGLARLAQHVVVDIGQVLDVAHLVTEVDEVPMQDVEADVGECVAEVPRVVGRDAAHVQAHRPVQRLLERHERAATRVVEEEGHALDSRVLDAGR